MGDEGKIGVVAIVVAGLLLFGIAMTGRSCNNRDEMHRTERAKARAGAFQSCVKSGGDPLHCGKATEDIR